MALKRLLFIGIIIGLVGCQAENLEVDEKQSNLTKTNGAAAALSESEYDALTPEQQYQVANKLLGTLYKGIPASSFFDTKAGTEELKVSGGKNILTETHDALKERIAYKDGYVSAIEIRHNLDAEHKASTKPLATIKEFPLSRDMFEEWMAYTLANTILFSPASEIASASFTDVQRIYDNLVSAMSEDASIRDIILAHQKSQANWRRFRSPEDNTREMIEIYLGLFDRDEDVPKASIACRNWYIDDNGGKYDLIIDNNYKNSEPQFVLDSWVTSCEDFYEVIANHPLVIPRMTTFLVDRFFPNFSSEKRAAIVQDIVATNPVRFHDIFTPILFSKEYLLNNEKAKSFEEAFFNISQRIYWDNNPNFMIALTDPDPRDSTQETLYRMKQPPMSLKLGRFKDQPLDSLSFAYYHKAMRSKLLIDGNPTNNWGGWDNTIVHDGDYLSDEDYVDLLFISIVSRKPTQNELTDLELVFNEINDDKIIDERKKKALVVFDYLSRLPELYYYNKI